MFPSLGLRHSKPWWSPPGQSKFEPSGLTRHGSPRHVELTVNLSGSLKSQPRKEDKNGPRSFGILRIALYLEPQPLPPLGILKVGDKLGMTRIVAEH